MSKAGRWVGPCYREDHSTKARAVVGITCSRGEGIMLMVDYTGTGQEPDYCPACGSTITPWAPPSTLEAKPCVHGFSPPCCDPKDPFKPEAGKDGAR